MPNYPIPEAHIADALPQLLALLRDASALILTHYYSSSPIDAAKKTDSTPLTAADIASHEFIKLRLRELFPNLPVLSEESSAATKQERLWWSDYLLVDPTDEFTINIALIRDHQPILGLIAQPVTGTIWFGGKGWGAYRIPQGADLTAAIALKARALNLDATQGITLLASARHRNEHLDRLLSYLEDRGIAVTRHDSGSALKFPRLAEGLGDIYPRYSTCCEWDTGAGQAIVEGAGGAVLGMDAQPLSYNRHTSLMSPHFWALADSKSDFWRSCRLQLER
jgi:3'(2'), 5'-bisphosphate nucleotidase